MLFVKFAGAFVALLLASGIASAQPAPASIRTVTRVAYTRQVKSTSRPRTGP